MNENTSKYKQKLFVHSMVMLKLLCPTAFVPIR